MTGEYLSLLSDSATYLGDAGKGEALARESIATQLKFVGKLDLTSRGGPTALANALVDQGRIVEARRVYEEIMMNAKDMPRYDIDQIFKAR